VIKTKKHHQVSSKAPKDARGFLARLTGADDRVQSGRGAPDMVLLGTVSLLVFFGLLMIASAGSIYGDYRFDDAYYFFKQQIVGVVLGFIALFILQGTNYHFFRRWSLIFFIIAIGLLIAVMIPGLGISALGARRWIEVGGISFQPAEAVKLAMILYISAWCASKGVKRISDTMEGFVPFLIMLSCISFLIVLQPDVGTMVVVALTAVTIFFASGAHLKHIVTLFLLGASALAGLIVAAPYRLERFTTFLNPSADAQDSGYQIIQALIAIGSGGIAGLGLGASRQKALYLPEPVGDSIFAIIAEELGLWGSFLLLALFGIMLWRFVRIALQAPDVFGRLTTIGIGVWLIGQAMMNIAAITGIMPLTGIPLTFISFGGTAMIFSLAAIGIVLNISRYSR
jgi:cell division protein FtsW